MPTKPISLTDHDLRQMDDPCLSALTAEEKEALLVRALFDLRKSRSRLNQSPRNSSKPPSSHALWEAATANDTADERSSAGGLTETISAAADSDTTRAGKMATLDKTTVQKLTGGKDARATRCMPAPAGAGM